MDENHTTTHEAASAVLTLINFFTVLGFHGDAEKKLGGFVNELFRGESFTWKVESILNDLDELLEWILDMMEVNASIMAEEMEALYQQTKSLKDEISAEKRADTKRTKRGGTHEKCFLCGSRRCGENRPTWFHAHPEKPHKAHK